MMIRGLYVDAVSNAVVAHQSWIFSSETGNGTMPLEHDSSRPDESADCDG